jgi:S1-C subfamily serine protease
MATVRRNPSAALLLALAVGGCDGNDAVRVAATGGGVVDIERELGGSVPEQVDTTSTARLSGAFRTAAARALSAVVQIEVISRGMVQVPAGPYHEFIAPEQRRERMMHGTGSGFLIDTLGHILTNHHVVENALDIRVRLVDGRELQGELVGSDANTDVAVIVAAEPHYRHRLQTRTRSVGDWVLALGVAGTPVLSDSGHRGAMNGASTCCPTAQVWKPSFRLTRPSTPATPAARWWT